MVYASKKIAPNKEKPEASEDQLHRSVVTFCQYRLKPEVVMHHSMNEGKRTPKEQSQVKGYGMAKGFPDLVFFHERRAYFIELKSMVGRISPAQRTMAETLCNQGFEHRFVTSAKDAEHWLGVWGLLKKTRKEIAEEDRLNAEFIKSQRGDRTWDGVRTGERMAKAGRL